MISLFLLSSTLFFAHFVKILVLLYFAVSFSVAIFVSGEKVDKTILFSKNTQLIELHVGEQIGSR